MPFYQNVCPHSMAAESCVITYKSVVYRFNCSDFLSRSCWLLIWLWIARTNKLIFGTEYLEMSTWHMLFQNATIVLKRFFTPWLTKKEDFGIFLVLLCETYALKIDMHLNHY